MVKILRVRSALTLIIFLFAAVSLHSADFKRDVIYQIITDRFFDGDPANNNPPQSAGLYDPTRTQWRAYWGGDLAGIQAKLPYLKDMGITAIWISPPVDNENLNQSADAAQIEAPYHGYQARDFMRIEEHFGDAGNSWTAFDNLVKAAHKIGIKVIVDFAPNHSNNNHNGEFGALYKDGVLLGNYTNDTKGYYHHNPDIAQWEDRYQTQYHTLAHLADFNQENQEIDAYLKSAAKLFQDHGVDGFRVDAIKHTGWGWLYSFANSIYTNKDAFMFGEWIADTTSNPLYGDLYKFANRSGFSVLNFPLYTAINDVFVWDHQFWQIENLLAQQTKEFRQPNDLVNFLDNHDRKRFLSAKDGITRDRLHEALALLLTAPGVPTIYYGTEQYLSGGDDPYNRPMMNNWDTTTTAYQLIKQLASLRHTNSAIGNGTMTQRWINDNVYVYEREFAGNVALVAINRSAASDVSIGGLYTALPKGTYTDYLNGLLGHCPVLVSKGGGHGPVPGALSFAPTPVYDKCSITVGNGGGNNPVSNFVLPAHTVAVWQFTPVKPATPVLASVFPDVAQPGVSVTLAGSFAGTNTVKFGAASVPPGPGSDAGHIVAKVPSMPNGNYNLTVSDSTNHVSNPVPFTVLAANLIPVTFTVNNATPTNWGDNIFLTGSTVELGNWNTSWDGAVGPMLTPNYPNWFLNVSVPAGKTIEFKFIKIAQDKTVTWEAGPNHQYTVPATGTGSVNVNWQY